MKNLLYILAIILLVFLIGCSGNTTTKDKQAKQVMVKKELSVRNYIQAFQKTKIPINNIIYYSEETDVNKLLGRPNQYIQKANWADNRIEQPVDNIENMMKGDPQYKIQSKGEYEKELKEAMENPSGGTIEIFDNAADLKNRKKYIEALSKGSPMFNQYIYVHKKALIRLENDLTPKQASDYEKVLKSLK